MGKISDRNSVISFFDEFLVIDGKFSKMTVTREERPMDPHPFGVFLVLSGPIYGQNITSKAFNHFGHLPLS
jgi:hypothetical protein